MTEKIMLERRSTDTVNLNAETLQKISEQMAAAVADGIKAAITEDTAQAFWSAGLAVLQKSATQHAGRFVVGGLLAMLRKIGTFLVLGGIFYTVGGWAGLALLFNGIFGNGGGQ